MIFQDNILPFIVLNEFNLNDQINVFGFFNPVYSKIHNFFSESIIKNFSLNVPWKFSLIWLNNGSFIFSGKRLINIPEENEKMVVNQMKSFLFNVFFNRKNQVLGCKNSFLKFLSGKVFLPCFWVNGKDTPFFKTKVILKDFVLATPSTVSQQSGEFYVKSKNNILDIKGSLFLEKGFGFFNSFLNQPLTKIVQNTEGYWNPFVLNLNVRLKTLVPLQLNILNQPFLAEGDLTLQGKIKNNFLDNLQGNGRVKISGENVSLIDHKFNFIEAKLFFENSQILNPIIQANLITKINRYLLRFNVFGVMDDLIISAKANPSLTEAQIFSLFFTGIKDQREGLRHLFSALLTKRSSIFENPVNYKKSLLQKIISPTENIRFFPGVINSFGTSLPTTASILVNLGDNFSAVIEKDFKKYEDIKLSLEYMLSENVAIKMNRDFEGFLQALFELRFKF